jgi:hypothetical protein
MNFNEVLMRRAYQDMKWLDPHHVTIGAVDCGDLWMYSDGEMGPHGGPAHVDGALSLDLLMIENYNADPTAHVISLEAGGSYDRQLRQWPMQWEPIVNCPWGESSWENAAATYSPKRLRALTYTGLVLPATMVHQLYFDLCSLTEQPLADSVVDMASELLELMPSLLPELTVRQSLPPIAVATDSRVIARGISVFT